LEEEDKGNKEEKRNYLICRTKNQRKKKKSMIQCIWRVMRTMCSTNPMAHNYYNDDPPVMDLIEL
jgi:hypothetical protein